MTASKPPTGAKPPTPEEKQENNEWHTDESNTALDHADENASEEEVEADEWGEVQE